ncbi:hypothetical protein GCM10025771_11610 [Niveibacterium umoris]|uniref:Uncharacterized protein n=1 Tax=Niveibacterium umoris TaxID=1193620 RepID=A0A840BR58_9RHOO|nr:hypothetical protein [Niveibacterium umoris]MBB4013286.1 hypothetical protein [Niveibacterium umoris]
MMITVAAALATIAIVTQDQTALRAAPRDAAQAQTVLWQGDSLEIRGEKGDFLQVYDHRHERAGFVRATQVRVHALTPEAAPELLSVVRFLREANGAETLGIAYATAYLKAAPAAAIDAEPFDALGVMAERLARRASTRQSKAGEVAIAAQMEVAANYGVEFVAFERNGQMQTCYNGDAFRRVLGMRADDGQRARAALALTRHDCVPGTLTPVERAMTDAWRAEVLDRVELKNLSEVTRNRLHMRKAGVWSAIAYEKARKADAALPAATRAIEELAAVNKAELTEDDAPTYADAGLRVGASRWAAVPEVGMPRGKLALSTTPGQQPGETCVALQQAEGKALRTVLTRCTFGLVWAASAQTSAQGDALALAVQPMATWRELWLFHQRGGEWVVDVLPPAIDNPDLGYVEFAGWVPGGNQFLAAREVRAEGRYKQSFEVLSQNSLQVERWADRANALAAFVRWQDPAWKRGTVSVR